VGIVCLHYGWRTTAGKNGEAFERWIGGYFEPNWSVNPFWEIKDMNAGRGAPHHAQRQAVPGHR